MSFQTDIDVIAQVEKYPILWDNRRKDFRNKKAQEVTWLLIAENLRTDVSDVQYRWRNIRTKYVRRRAESSRSGDEAGSSVKWPLMRYLDFLLPTVRHRKTLSNVCQQPASDFYGDSSQIYYETQISPGSNAEMSQVKEMASEPQDIMETPHLSNSEMQDSKITLQRKRKRTSDAALINFLEHTGEVLKKKSQEEEDETMVFFKSCVGLVKDFTPIQHLEFRKSVLETIENIRKRS